MCYAAALDQMRRAERVTIEPTMSSMFDGGRSPRAPKCMLASSSVPGALTEAIDRPLEQRQALRRSPNIDLSVEPDVVPLGEAFVPVAGASSSSGVVPGNAPDRFVSNLGGNALLDRTPSTPDAVYTAVDGELLRRKVSIRMIQRAARLHMGLKARQLEDTLAEVRSACSWTQLVNSPRDNTDVPAASSADDNVQAVRDRWRSALGSSPDEMVSSWLSAAGVFRPGEIEAAAATDTATAIQASLLAEAEQEQQANQEQLHKSLAPRHAYLESNLHESTRSTNQESRKLA